MSNNKIIIGRYIDGEKYDYSFSADQNDMHFGQVKTINGQSIIDITQRDGIRYAKNLKLFDLEPSTNKFYIYKDGKRYDYQLSSNGFTTAYKTKLDGIEAGAQVNTVLGVKGASETTYRTGNINITTTNIGAIPASAIGAASGVAPLNASSLIDAKYLPSYVDDVLEFAGKGKFPATGESGKIYVDTTAEENNTYRWSGTTYILIAKNTNTTYKLSKSGSLITLTGSDGSTTSVTDNNTTYSIATQSTNGLMSSTDKTKLDDIENGANKYVLPAATSSVLGGVKIGSNITISSGTISLTSANITAALGYTPVTAEACSDTNDYDDLF